jgi:hypothetical protein
MKTRINKIFDKGELFYRVEYLARIQNDIEIWVNVCSYPWLDEGLAIERAIELSKKKNNG